MFRFALIATLLATPALAAAQTAASGGQPPQRIRSVTLTKGQKCPASTGNEVVVCRTLEEPYRIPAPLRQGEPAAANQSWVNRAASLDQTSRVAGGLPDTCSPVGTGGQSGCALATAQAYAAEKRAAARAAESVPGGR